MTLNKALRLGYTVEIRVKYDQFDDLWARYYLVLSKPDKKEQTGAYIDGSSSALDDPLFLNAILDKLVNLAYEVENDNK